MIVLGRIIEPYGIQGWVKVQPFGDDPGSWRKMPTWWLSADAEAPADAWAPQTLRGCRVHGKGLVAAFDGVGDRTGAEGFEGCYIGAPREALPAPDEGEYYWGDLVGLAVTNTEGVALGVVTGLIETGAHAVLQVRDGEHERLIPFVAAYVGEIDLQKRTVQVVWGSDW